MEINPKDTIKAYQIPAYTPCGPWITSYDRLNPWQVVWNSISFAPDPYQQMFNFQDNRYGPGLQRRTYTIDPNKYYNITLLQSDEYSYFTYGGFWDSYAGNYVPIQYVGTTLNGVLGSDLGAIAWFDYVRDYPNGLYYSYSNKYNLKIKRDVPPGTEIIMSVFDGQETINYHTRVETPTFTIENDTSEDTLLHNQSRDIEFLLNFQNPGNCQLGDYGGAYPTGIKFNVEIVQGQQYGNLYYPGTVADPDQSGISITNLEDDYGGGICNYIIRYTADGVQPDTSTPAIVTIRCTANDADIAPAEVSFPIKYSDEPLPSIGGYILVDFNKDSFSPGDTAITNCKWLTAYNEILDFPGDQSFNAEIVSGKEYGMLLDPNNGTVSNILDGLSNGFKVITAASIPYDSVVIRIRVTTIADNGGIIAASIKSTGLSDSQITKSIKELDRKKSSSSIKSNRKEERKNSNYDKDIKNAIIPNSIVPPSSGGELIFGIGHIKVAPEATEIMLGETKYFGVKKKTATGELKIEEIKTEYGNEPQFPADADGWEWQKTDVWGDVPIEKLGTKSGVYWEKKWFDKTDNKNKDFTSNNIGIIRLIGRYWEEGKEDSFKVKLKTTNHAEIELRIVKSKNLGTKYNDSKDVFKKPLNLDSLCTITGGLNGVPPQIIKGQMEKETTFQNSFRYEARLDIEVQNNKSKKKEYLDDHPYYTVTEPSMGTIEIPSNHFNVTPVHYVTNPTKISDYLVENIVQYIRKPKQDKNGKWLDPYFVGYEKGKPSTTLKDTYKYALKILKKSREEAINYATDSLKKWLKTDEFSDGKKYAQTRIFSSYGMLQQIFYFACTDKIAGYAISNDKQSPESLNEMDYSIKAYKEKIGKKLMNKSDNQWEHGFEEDWATILRSYNNGESNYGKDVVEFSKQYLPKK